MKQYKIEYSLRVIDLENNEAVIDQEASYKAAPAAIHEGLRKIGEAMIYGGGVSLSQEMIDAMGYFKKQEKERSAI